MKIIAINGPKGTGKSTMAAALVQTGHDARVFHLADPIKEHVAGPTWEDYEHLKDKEWGNSGKTLRQMYIEHGEAEREKAEGVWVRQFDERSYDAGYGVAIIADLRKQFEIEMLETLYGRDNILVIHSLPPGSIFANADFAGDLGEYVTFNGTQIASEFSPERGAYQRIYNMHLTEVAPEFPRNLTAMHAWDVGGAVRFESATDDQMPRGVNGHRRPEAMPVIKPDDPELTVADLEARRARVKAVFWPAKPPPILPARTGPAASPAKPARLTKDAAARAARDRERKEAKERRRQENLALSEDCPVSVRCAILAFDASRESKSVKVASKIPLDFWRKLVFPRHYVRADCVAAIMHVMSWCAGTNLEALKSSDRSANLALARQASAFILYNRLRLSYASAGRYLGRDHTTVIYAEKAIRLKLESGNVQLLNLIQQFMEVMAHVANQKRPRADSVE